MIVYPYVEDSVSSWPTNSVQCGWPHNPQHSHFFRTVNC